MELDEPEEIAGGVYRGVEWVGIGPRPNAREAFVTRDYVRVIGRGLHPRALGEDPGWHG